jgi:hypothetical protein
VKIRIVRDNGETLDVEPMDSRTSTMLVETLSESELSVFGVAMMLVSHHVRGAAQELTERKAKENPLETLKRMLGGSPNFGLGNTSDDQCNCSDCTALRERLLNDKLAPEETNDSEPIAGRGMYL